MGKTRKACVVGFMRFPTSVIDKDGTYVGPHKARVEVCRSGGGYTVTVHSPVLGTIKLRSSEVRREARRYARLARKLPCPGARAAARQLAREWGSFERELRRLLR